MDGFIADENGNIDFLQTVPNPENIDMGYLDFTQNIDTILMGRNTYETVLGFGIDWPYDKTVFVASNTLKSIPTNLENKVELISGTSRDIIKSINKKGYNNIYVDGGKLIQSMLKENLIDELIISIIPVLLGKGISLFGETNEIMKFELIESKVFINNIVQNKWKKI